MKPNLNIMKTPKLNIMKNNYLKGGILALMMIAGTAIQAQDTTNDFTQQGNATPGTDGTSVKVIDNKGTIKYLQVANGLTSFTNTTTDKTTTTWQLGGTLTDDTYIDVDASVFALDGLTLESATNAATTAPTGSDHGGANTGWTLVVRDEATGALKKLLATDLISGIREVHTQTTDGVIGTAVDITVTGLPTLTAGSTFAKLFVYRNGAKLRSVTDFVATAGKITITPSSDIPMYAGDVVEIQYIK